MPEYYVIAKDGDGFCFCPSRKTEEIPPHRDYIFSEEGAIVTQRELLKRGIEAYILQGVLDSY